MATFKAAKRHNIWVRQALCGPTGSGKTYTALGIATVLAEGHPVAVIDTERSSADRYADKFSFDTCPLDTFSPEAYIDAIESAAAAGYRALVIDSLSHAWDGAEGLLERVDNIAKRKGGNTFNAWADGTPLQRRLVDTILAYPGHVIATMRSKMEYLQEKDDRTGKTTIKKVGLAPVQRQGIEYEFDLVGEMDTEHNLVMTKSRAETLADRVVNRPGRKFAAEILAWARGATPPAHAAPQPAPLPPAETAARAAQIVAALDVPPIHAPEPPSVDAAGPTEPPPAPVDDLPTVAPAPAPTVVLSPSCGPCEPHPATVAELDADLDTCDSKEKEIAFAIKAKGAIASGRVSEVARQRLLARYGEVKNQNAARAAQVAA